MHFSEIPLPENSPIPDSQTASKDTGISDGHLVRPGVDLSHGGILYLDSISVSFDGFKALDDLSLIVDAGELRCVIGPNGAGKTTMMDVITGKTRPDSGSAYFGQTIDLSRLTEPEIAGRGIGASSRSRRCSSSTRCSRTWNSRARRTSGCGRH